MPLSKDIKDQIIAEYATHEGDTGSPEVQIATTTPVVACCCWSAVVVACWVTWLTSTSSVTARSSSVSACAADFGPARLP